MKIYEMVMKRGESIRDSATCTLAGAKELMHTDLIDGWFWTIDPCMYITDDGLKDYDHCRKILKELN